MEPARQGVERRDELILGVRSGLVRSPRGMQVGVPLGRAAARPLRKPVPVVPVRGDRALLRLLEEVRRAFGSRVARNGERSYLLQQALPIPLHAVEPVYRHARAEPAVFDAAEGSRHVAPPRTGLHEEVLDSENECAQIVVALSADEPRPRPRASAATTPASSAIAATAASVQRKRERGSVALSRAPDRRDARRAPVRDAGSLAGAPAAPHSARCRADRRASPASVDTARGHLPAVRSGRGRASAVRVAAPAADRAATSVSSSETSCVCRQSARSASIRSSSAASRRSSSPGAGPRQRASALELARRCLRVTRGEMLSALTGELLELIEVELALLDTKRIARRLRDQDARRPAPSAVVRRAPAAPSSPSPAVLRPRARRRGSQH